MHPSIATVTTCLLTAASASAQLGIGAVGGSVPGSLALSAGPHVPDGTWGLVLVSTQLASVPWSILDAADPRSSSVGLESSWLWQSGLVTGGAGRFDAPPIPIPNQASLIDAALFCQATHVPGLLYFIGSLSQPVVVRFGPAGSFHDRAGIMTKQRAFFTPVPLADGRVLVAGGGGGGLLTLGPDSQADIYDPLTDTFDNGPGAGRYMISSRALYTATVLVDGRVAFIGGLNLSNDPVTTVDVYDPVTDQFTLSTARMAQPRMGHTATMLPDGRVLVAGGLSDMHWTLANPLLPIYSILNTTEIYDPFADRFTPGPVLSRPRAGHAAILRADRTVLLAGGISYDGPFAGVTATPTGTATGTASGPLVRTGPAPVVASNEPTAARFGKPVVERSTDVVDVAAMTRTAGTDMQVPRAMFSFVETGDGRWLAAGGLFDPLSPSPTKTAEIYDPATEAWTQVASMQGPRALHAAFPWGPGKILHVMGGDGTLLVPIPLATTEIYDLATDTWAPGPTSPFARAAFGSYENGRGQVHVLGGSDGSPQGARTTDTWIFR